MRLQRVAAQRCVHSELSHASGERSRGSVGNARHLNLDGGSCYPAPHGTVVVLEEIVEDAARRLAAGAYIDQAHQLGGVDCHLSGLLGDKRPGTQHRGVVDVVSYAFAMELDVGGRLLLLTPEPVERGELGVLEAGYVNPVVKLECGADGFSHNRFGLADGEAHEEVVAPVLGGAPLTVCGSSALGGTASLLTLLRRCAVGHHLYRGASGRNRIALYGSRRPGKVERTRAARQEDVGVRGLRGLGLLAVHYADGRGRAFLRPPDKLEVVSRFPTEV